MTCFQTITDTEMCTELSTVGKEKVKLKFDFESASTKEGFIVFLLRKLKLIIFYEEFKGTSLFVET